MSNSQTLQNVINFDSLIEYLRDELDWDFQAEDIEDLTFDYEPAELGLDEATAAKIDSIKQLRPFTSNQPWGIFWIDFGEQKSSATAMRALLRTLVKRKRESDNDSDRQRFALGDLLFILTSEGYDKFDFAYFRGKEVTRATLAMFGWRKGEEHVRTLKEYNLPKLSFPTSLGDPEAWLKQWREAFDVEKVTNDFFNGYKAIFFKAENALKKSIPDKITNDKEAQETRRIFAQRLFNRLMFIYFLQKKGWLSFGGDKNYLSALFAEAKRVGEKFFQKRLYYLFFHGLSLAGEVSESKAKTDLAKLIGDVPYLNGGLFEIEDEFDVKDRVELENELFEEVFDFFSKFNFTVEESTPLDIQVAVDPEMLGKIFEKVITERESEKSERKNKGRYYTPRYVVSFMYRESLKHFLTETEINQQKIKDLVDGHKSDQITVPEAETLLDKLDKLKIIDPACGSGAYLLGCLQELFIIRQKLDPLSRRATAKDDYHRKLRIIQQNIHGVDLDNFAVQIARLRLWLSLVVDFEGDTPEPLPNLNFKIEQGDSLTSPNPNDTQGSLFGDIISEFAKAKSEFFLLIDENGKPVSPDEKDRRRKNTIDKREKLRSEIAKWRSVRGFSTSQGFDWQVDFGEVFLNGGFDIVLANPPYGAESSDKTLREKFFAKGTTQSKDTYGLFIARGLELLRPNGTLCYIVSDTWRTIKSHKPLRKKILDETTVKHFVDLPSWIFDATVNTNILTITKTLAPEDHKVIAGDLHNLANKDWDALYKNLEAVAEHGFDAQTLDYARYTYPQSLISTYDNLSFFIASPKLYELMSDARFQKLGAIADVKVGLQTSNNEYYLRKREGVRGTYGILDENKLLTEAEIAALSDDEKRNGVDPKKYGGRHFLPYDKGGESDSASGWMPNYYVPTGYFIDWSITAIHLLTTDTSDNQNGRIAARFQNREYYFRRGLSFSPTGIYSPTFRLGCNAIFGNKGSTIFFNQNFSNSFIGILTSIFVRYVLKSFLSHTVETGEDVLVKMPFVALSNEAKTEIEILVTSIIEKQKADQFYSYHLHEQKEIDALVYPLYGLTAEDIREVEIWYCRRYDKLSKAQGFWAEVEAKYTDYLKHCETVLSKPPSYWSSHPIKQLIAQGEGQRLDFKEFFGVSKSGQNQAIVRDDNASRSTLKTINSFLNSNGGTLLIGVSDPGEITGINHDVSILTNKTPNEFKEKTQNLINSRFTPQPTNLIDISFEPLQEGIVCRIDVAPSNRLPIYFDGRIYVRNGIRGDEKSGNELTMWIQQRTA